MRGNATCNSGRGHWCTGRSLGTWNLGLGRFAIPNVHGVLVANYAGLQVWTTRTPGDRFGARIGFVSRSFSDMEVLYVGSTPVIAGPSAGPTCVHRRLLWNLLDRKTLTAATCQTVVRACWHEQLQRLDGASRATTLTWGQPCMWRRIAVAVRERLPRRWSMPQRKCCGTKVVSRCETARTSFNDGRAQG